MQKHNAILTAADLKRLFARCVYAWQRDNEDGDVVWLYVGQTGKGIARFANHHVVSRDKVLDGDRILVWHIETEKEALALEAELIHRHSPIFNQALRIDLPGKIREPKIKRVRIGPMSSAEFKARVEAQQRKHLLLHPRDQIGYRVIKDREAAPPSMMLTLVEDETEFDIVKRKH